MVGVGRSELTGQPFGMVVSPQDRAAFRIFLKLIIAREDKQSGDFELVARDRLPRLVHIEARRSPNKLECGALMVDITAHTMLYRVAQEDLTNVARHAKASQVEVNIQQPNGTIRMEITDNGNGFQVAGKSSSAKHNRLGHLGMRERAEMAGGTFSVESVPGQATTVRGEIPPGTKRARKIAPKPSI